MEELDDYYKNKGGCDVKAMLIAAVLASILSLIFGSLD